jgi:hypothetical protein
MNEDRTGKSERQGYVVTNDAKRGALYWGPGPLAHARLVGTFKRPIGDEGALIQTSQGILVQGNAGCFKSVPSIVMELAIKAGCDVS